MGGRLREFADEWMGITQDPLHFGNSPGESVIVQSEAPSGEAYQQVQGKDSKESGEHDGFRSQISVVWGHHRCWPREQWIFHIPLLDSKENWAKLPHYESKTTEKIHNLHKIKDDNPETDQGSHSPRAVGSLT